MAAEQDFELPPAPDGLSDRAAALWSAVLADLDESDRELSPHEMTLWHEALISLDRADQAAAVIAAEGVTVVDRYGSPKAHPAVDVEARSRTLFARITAQLKLTGEDAVDRFGRAKPGPKSATPKGRS